MYRNLMKEWSLHEIDEMDILFYFELIAEEKEVIYADQVQW